jgi:hypothetical protein
MGFLTESQSPLTALGALIGDPAAVEARRALAAVEELGRWADLAERAYSESTQRAWRADWRVFCNYCSLNYQLGARLNA